jgi:hypothetical protein
MVWMVGLAGAARAQAVYVPNYWEDRPKLEIAGTFGLASLFGSGPAGVRVTRRLSPWVSLEVGADRQEQWNLGPAYRLLNGSVRLSAPFEPRRGPASITEGPGSVFVTLGVARASGLPWQVSPMIGLGIQSPYVGEVLALRFEYQRFTQGVVPHHDRSRLMLSAVLGLKI